MGRRLDDAEFVFAVCEWIAANPKAPRFLRREGWDASALANRTVEWIGELSRRATTLPREFVARASASIAEQIRFLERHPEASLEHAKALLLAGGFFAGAEGERWTSRGLETLAAELERQILPDGVHRERSLTRHLEAFADLLECRAAVEERELGATLDRMAQAAVDLRHPDESSTTAECLRAHAALGGRTPFSRPSFSFPSAAFFGLRGEASLLLVDGDDLGFAWSVGGLRLVSAHARSAGKAVVEDVAQREDSLRFVGSHDGHRRVLRATTRGIDVEDEVVDGTGRPGRAEFLLHPEVRVEVRRDARSVVLRRKGVAVLLETSSPIRVVPAIDTLQVVIHYGLAPCTGEFSLRSAPELREPALDLDARPSLAVGRSAPVRARALEQPILS
jgi:hypothetical protein